MKDMKNMKQNLIRVFLHDLHVLHALHVLPLGAPDSRPGPLKQLVTKPTEA